MLAGSKLAQLSLDRLRVFANQDQLAHLLLHQWSERAVRRFLPTSAQNQNDFSSIIAKRLKGLERGINAGGFRIVVKLHAVDLGDEFETMLDRLKVSHRLAHRFCHGAASESGGE